MKTCEELLATIAQGESQTLEFKNSLILQDSTKLARAMVSFANALGGRILVGVNDNHEIEGMTANNNDQELIMNVASDKCDPRLHPRFSTISCPGKGDVYVIEIPPRQEMYHSVKIRNGIVFPVRVGSTVRQLSAAELGYATQGIEIGVRNPLGSLWLWLGKKSLRRFYSSLSPQNNKIRNYLLSLGVISFILIVLPLVMMFGFSGRELTVKFTDYPSWFLLLLIMSMLIGGSMLDFIRYFPETKCPNCNSYFSFYPIRKWVFDKRQIDETKEEWITRSLKKCNECDYEVLGKRQYEVRSIEEEYGL